MTFPFACPTCRTLLSAASADERTCGRCGVTYRRHERIWRLLAEERRPAYADFVRQYETVRAAEGRRMTDARALEALPFRAPSRAGRREWRIRAKSFRCLVRRVIEPLEDASRRPLQVLDLGSGAGWLAHRLALRGHDVAAVDIVTNDFDGLGVHRRYPREFLSVEAEYDRLPFADASADVVVYNASFHYATDFARALHEALRVLRPAGAIAIVDSPLYRDPASGAAMVREREEDFLRRYGFRGNALRSEGYLTYARLAELASALGVRWQLIEPWYGLRWWAKPGWAWLRRRREPARFKLIVGRRRE